MRAAHFDKFFLTGIPASGKTTLGRRVLFCMDAKDSAGGWLYRGGLDGRGLERDSVTSMQAGMTRRF